MLSQRAKNISSTTGYSQFFELAARIKNPCNLSIGQPHFDVPEPIKQAAVDAMRNGGNAYTPVEGLLTLRQAVLQQYAEKGNPQEGVVITSGVTGGLVLSLLAVMDPGDEVVMSDPYYLANKHLTRILGGTPVYVDTYPDFRWKAEKLAAVITPRTKAIMVTSPSNPTGQMLTEQEAEAIVAIARKQDLWILYDQVYEVYDYVQRPIALSQFYPKTITLNGFSKSHSMTGWRVGTAAGSTEVTHTLTNLQQYCHICPPSLGQWGALTAMRTSTAPQVAAYKKNRDRMVAALQPYYDFCIPEGAFFIFMPAPQGMTGSAFSSYAAEKEGLLIFPGNVFSERDTHTRVSFAVDEAMLDRGIHLLQKMATRRA